MIMSVKRKRTDSGGEEYELDLTNHATAGKQDKISTKPWIFIINPTKQPKHNDWKRIFSPYGKVIDIVMKSEFGLASVQIDKRVSTDNGIKQLAGINLEDKKVLVRFTSEGKSVKINTCHTSGAAQTGNNEGRAIKVENLSPMVTNELLAKAFGKFGKVERATVLVDAKGQSTTKGIVIFNSKTSAQFAILQIKQGSFLITSSTRPVTAKLYEQDFNRGLSDKLIGKTSKYLAETCVEPRFAVRGSFEEECSRTWKYRYELERQQREQLEENIKASRALFESQMEECCAQAQQQKQNDALINQQQTTTTIATNRSPIVPPKPPRLSITNSSHDKQDAAADKQQTYKCLACRWEFANEAQLRHHLTSCLIKTASLSHVISNQQVDTPISATTSNLESASTTAISTSSLITNEQTNMEVPRKITPIQKITIRMPNDVKNKTPANTEVLEDLIRFQRREMGASNNGIMTKHLSSSRTDSIKPKPIIIPDVQATNTIIEGKTIKTEPNDTTNARVNDEERIENNAANNEPDVWFIGKGNMATLGKTEPADCNDVAAAYNTTEEMVVDHEERLNEETATNETGFVSLQKNLIRPEEP